MLVPGAMLCEAPPFSSNTPALIAGACRPRASAPSRVFRRAFFAKFRTASRSADPSGTHFAMPAVREDQMGSNVRALGEAPMGLSLRRLLNRDFLVAVALFVATVIMLTNLKLAMVNEYQGDTALFFQMTDNIAERGLPVSSLFQNLQTNAVQRNFRKTAEQLANDPLTPTSVAEGNMFGLHAYYIMYP